MKIGYKLALFYTLLSGFVLLLFSLFYYIYINVTLYSVADNELQYISGKVIEYYIVGHNELQSFLVEQDLIQDNWILLTTSENKVVFASGTALRFPIDLNIKKYNKSYFNYTFHEADSKNYSLFWPADKKVNYRFMAKSFIINNSFSYNIIIGIPINNITSSLKRLRYSFIISFVIFIVIFSVAGYAFSRYSLRPIQHITQDIDQITSKSLSKRVRIINKKDEIGKLTTAINELFNRLEDSFMLQKQFISDVSHELKTPLTILSLTLENLLKDGNVSPDQENKIMSLLETAHSMDTLIKKLLLLARLDEAQSPLSLEKINLRDLLMNIYDGLLPVAENKSVDFVLNIPENLVLIEGDKNLLTVALFNIVENAIKYTARGKVSITLDITENIVNIRVKDTGMGIPDDAVSKVFERFYRVDDSRHKTEGFGIGLSISKKIIELHNGKIEIESRLGEGTNMIISLALSK